MEIPSCFYRVSVKALILDETRTKFLLCKEKKGTWDFPGGGLDFGEQPIEGLKREVGEEMGIGVTEISEKPSYFIVAEKVQHHCWMAHVFYEVMLEHLNFVPSDECLAIQFFSKEEVLAMDNLLPNVQAFAEQF